MLINLIDNETIFKIVNQIRRNICQMCAEFLLIDINILHWFTDISSDNKE